MAGIAIFTQGNALSLLLPDESVDLIVTSPPYFGLRSYQDGGEHYEGQIGSEASPEAFLAALWSFMAEAWRVLAPTGSVWVNLGDRYDGGKRTPYDLSGGKQKGKQGSRTASNLVRPKSLLMLPARFAIGCTDENDFAGGQWILREEVIWEKPSCLPESVQDRCTRSHEVWMHFSKEERYFASLDPLREPFVGKPQRRLTQRDSQRDATMRPDKVHLHTLSDTPVVEGNEKGRAPRTVWSVPTTPLRVPADLNVIHTASFPAELPRRIILGWSPTAICQDCSEGIDSSDHCGCTALVKTPTGKRAAPDPSKVKGRAGLSRPRGEGEGTISITRFQQRHEAEEMRNSPHKDAMREEAGRAFTHYTRTDYPHGARALPQSLRTTWLERGWLTPPPPFSRSGSRPAVVLDPFGGSGTTAIVAAALGRVGISNDLSEDYIRLARWRDEDGTLAARARGEKVTAKRAKKKPPEAEAGK